MPFLKITTNSPVQSKNKVTQACSEFVSALLGKSEKFVMIEISDQNVMSFGGGTEPLAYIELKSIGLPIEKTKELSSKMCDFISEIFNIEKSRIYIEFSNVERNMWGWNGRTFEK